MEKACFIDFYFFYFFVMFLLQKVYNNCTGNTFNLTHFWNVLMQLFFTYLIEIGLVKICSLQAHIDKKIYQS